ncbi:2'-5' RNA ligase family protein [Acinetobacter stercoris]|uniref:2'-5' RNA ligase family protein n=1 Tax=Acinetobacter stercoris TaxID=2126983 RepID=A0A2U3MVY4_9GAMM|nr:2'-5' RNA ligase family protein [Acinetobacter stercoris]SPL69592.1 hypothetical protein KPC_0770 [Acinetobacter stercoris]
MFLLPSSKVLATVERDYPEWHRGRQQFALWYLEIQDKSLLNYLYQLREYFNDLLFTPNTRQFHITLFVCGFFTQEKSCLDDDFPYENLKKQLMTLSYLELPAFQLKTGKINSFTSALFVEIDDQMQMLTYIRKALKQHSLEIAALEYCPHITLGLYKAEIESDVIFQRIDSLDQKNFSVEVHQLSFGYYQAETLQGPLYPLIQFPLGEA